MFSEISANNSINQRQSCDALCEFSGVSAALYENFTSVPSRLALTFSRSNGEPERFTYDDVKQRVLSVARILVQKKLGGSRALLLFSPYS